jgi:hypothetical protein
MAWEIDGRGFDVSELLGKVVALESFEDSIRFRFSGDYDGLREHIEKSAHGENGRRYRVSKDEEISNKKKGLVSDCVVKIRRIQDS